MSVLALDLGGTKLAVALISPNGEIMKRDSFALGNRKGKEVGELITAQLQKFLTESNVKAIGISVPGISRQQTGTVWAPNIPGWEDYPIMKVMTAVAGGCNVVMDSDRACCIVGEHWKGKAQGCKDAIFIAVGTGIGAGIMVDGKILRGADDIAGAVGWLALQKPFHDKYIACGCFEYYASGDGIARYAKEILATENSYSGPLKVGRELTAQDVFLAYESNDVVATRVLNGCIELWGMAVANFVSIFNPRKIIFGGGVFGPAAKFVARIREEAVKWAQPVSITRVTIETSALNGNSAIYGAGFLAMESTSHSS